MKDRYISYLAAELETDSPLIIGSGLDENTDRDILLNSNGDPFIPGASLAGICRHYCLTDMGQAWVEEMYGKMNAKDNSGKSSRLIFYDASLTVPKSAIISGRDGVAIGNDRIIFDDKNGVAIETDRTALDGSKFDYEIIEAGAVFKWRLELHTPTTNGEAIREAPRLFKALIDGFNNGEMRLGAKKTRGFGKMKIVAIKWRQFDLCTHLDDYIDFSWKDTQLTDDAEVINNETPLLKSTRYITRKITFELRSFLFIRNLVTAAADSEDKIVDAEQLLNAKDELPVIPGTTWAGVFRHHCRRILKQARFPDYDQVLNKIFGNVVPGREKHNKQISQILFSESIVNDAQLLTRTRNAVDRFTGGAGDKKLFTGRAAYRRQGQSGSELTISLKADMANLDLVKKLIDSCLEDLECGFLTVGGEASVGGGLINISDKGEWA